MITRESAVLSAWYDSRHEIRRLWALRDTQGLGVLHVERALDSTEIHPVWMANRNLWIDELQLRTGSPVRLESEDGPFDDEVVTDAPGVIVAALSWRDSSFSYH